MSHNESGPVPGHPGVPSRWPSAWPSLAKPVLLGCIAPVAAAIVVVVVLALTSALSTAWWVVLLPIAVLAWPLSLPSRVRSVIQRAADAGTLDITVAQVGVLVSVRKRRLMVRPSAEVVQGSSGFAVRYYLQS